MIRLHAMVLSAGAVLAVGSASSESAMIVIDDFENGSLSFTSSANTSPFVASYESGLPSSSTAGGSRRLLVKNYWGSTPDVNPSGGSVSAGLFNAVRGGNGAGDLTLKYQGPQNPSAGTTVIADLSQATAINVTFAANSTGLLRVQAILEAHGFNYSPFSQQKSATISVPVGASVASIPISTLNLTPAGGFDNVAIYFSYASSAANQTFAVDSIVAVPEPSAVTALASACMLGLKRRRR